MCAASRLADVDALGIATREIEHLRRHQPVVENHVRVLQRSQRAQRQQTRIAGTGADQHDFARNFDCFAIARERIADAIAQRRIRRVFATRKHIGGHACRRRSFPRTRRRVPDVSMRALIVGRNLPASLARCAEPLRQERFELLAQTTREHRRIAAAADCNDDRRAIDDGRHDEARQLAIVDDVHRNVTPLGLVRDPRIDRDCLSVAAIASRMPSRCSG